MSSHGAGSLLPASFWNEEDFRGFSHVGLPGQIRQEGIRPIRRTCADRRTLVAHVYIRVGIFLSGTAGEIWSDDQPEKFFDRQDKNSDEWQKSGLNRKFFFC